MRYRVWKHRENRLYEVVIFYLAYAYFSVCEWLNNRREDAKMWKGKGWSRFCSGEDEGPESEEEVSRELERLREECHPEVAPEEEDDEAAGNKESER